MSAFVDAQPEIHFSAPADMSAPESISAPAASNWLMKLISVNTGLPRDVVWDGGTVKTSIFKEPIDEPVLVGRLSLVGDEQADLSVHGGPDKAVYGYPTEHYSYWGKELPHEKLPWGSFGENLTTEGLLENSVHIGDRFRIGEAELIVTQPRLPCYKLGIRFRRADMVKHFLSSRRTGFYFAVAREGRLKTGDQIELVAPATDSLTIADVTKLYAFERNDRDALQRAVQLKALPESWRAYFHEQLQKEGIS